MLECEILDGFAIKIRNVMKDYKIFCGGWRDFEIFVIRVIEIFWFVKGYFYGEKVDIEDDFICGLM